MRRSSVFLLVTAAGLLFVTLLPLHARLQEQSAEALLASSAGIARELQLTDLCLFTEARYTRHPSMADVHSAFQDHPHALDHFPSGSLASPPRFGGGP